MAESYKICPICNASNPGGANICWNCGTTLTGVENYSAPRKSKSPGKNYEFRYGETDLYEGELHAVGQRYLYGCFGILTALMIFGLAMVIGPSALDAISNIELGSNETSATETPIPPIIRPTVTQGPPTPTRTVSPTPVPTLTPVPTPEPCIQTVGPGEGLYAVVLRCGHRSTDVIDLVIELNNLASANDLREGQQIIVPYPTSVIPPTEPPTQQDDSSSSVQPTEDQAVAAASDSSAFDESFDPEFFPTPTLPPGIAWHTIQTGEDMISIIAQYDASVQILSELNPELTFSQCEFGIPFGGPRCTVLLIAGQQIRVPVPLPTPTLSPTPSGSETPTPTPTPTFNAPTILNPAIGTFFRRDELITLRWVPSGTLAEDELYRVIVEDRTAQIVYTADTQNTSFVVPAEWQGDDPEANPRHEFAWRVSVININAPDAPLFTTPTATFTWESSE